MAKKEPYKPIPKMKPKRKPKKSWLFDLLVRKTQKSLGSSTSGRKFDRSLRKFTDGGR